MGKDINKIIKNLKDIGIVDQVTFDYEPLSGGTTSRLYLVNHKYVIKINKPIVLETETTFLQFY
ncbi:hypothetical protein JOC86_000228 [Bacillus pakistanensis]|uniref:Aminoglycoside phosphotransferase n=1 Tax=Rossellomorea pakistanensis TaxID=992288 RepID=A0ABS2N7V7_9BACI|nr:hypothetical protein [Bacillus pakistanensis]MBM7583691.1 hypothetical protein [Bacillus pakistanensis]